MAHFDYENPTLKITAKDGILRVDYGLFDFAFIGELPLGELMKLYPRWQNLARMSSSDLPNLYMGVPKARKEIDYILRQFGLNAHRLTFNQIEALLFYELDKEKKYQPSILWRFHSVYPKALDLPSREPEIDHSQYIDLDCFEMACLYLMQEGKEHLIKEWPLSRIMKLMSAKSFLTWAANPDNKALILEKQNEKFLSENPTKPEDVKRMLEKRMFGK